MYVFWLQDVTEENAELALGVKANRGLIPRAAQLPGELSVCCILSETCLVYVHFLTLWYRELHNFQVSSVSLCFFQKLCLALFLHFWLLWCTKLCS